MSVILDASALLALLKDETGAAKVASVIEKARISAVNLAEVVSFYIHLGMPADKVDEMLAPLPLDIVPADAELARRAGQMRAETAEAGLSLGDRFCLALAARAQATALTADRRWLTVAQRLGVSVELIR